MRKNQGKGRRREEHLPRSGHEQMQLQKLRAAILHTTPDI
jgi:hypothetical protein